jgi:hypothetical protein
MNPRERNLLIILIAFVATGVGAFAGYRWFLVPFTEYNAMIRDMTKTNDDTKEIFDSFLDDRKKLELARLKSLPANQEKASLEYEQYLKSVLKKAGLNYDQISHSQAVEVKVVNPITGVKKTGHQVMEFKVKAQGELRQLIAALQQIQKTPYEHRIKTLNIDRTSTSAKDSSSGLNVIMTIETLLVAKTKNQPGMDINSNDKLLPLNPTPEDRSYAKIADKNIFVGMIPYVPKPPEFVKDIRPDVNLPAYIRLTTTIPDKQEAYLRNVFHNPRETRISAKPNSGFQEFRIIDPQTDYIFFKGKVLKVEGREVYFQVLDDVYAIHVGQNLADAMQFPLSIERLDDLDLERDREWGKKEKESQTKRNKGGGGGR